MLSLWVPAELQSGLLIGTLTALGTNPWLLEMFVRMQTLSELEVSSIHRGLLSFYFVEGDVGSVLLNFVLVFPLLSMSVCSTFPPPGVDCLSFL